MGLFFEERRPDPRLVELLSNALQSQPPANAAEQAAVRVGQFQPLANAVSSALAKEPPATPGDANALAAKDAQAITDELLGGPGFNSGRFFVALTIFLALLAAAIWTDADKLTNSPTALYALATTVFGVVVGFLGSEKVS